MGTHASQSYLRAAEEPRSPPAMSMTRNGRPMASSISFSKPSRRLCSSCASSGLHQENISTLSNWWTRMMPRVSLPWLPASRRKHEDQPQ